MAVGLTGNVYTISEIKSGGGKFIRVTKHAEADGAIIWSKVITGAGQNESGQIKVDSTGNIVISATIGGTSGYLAKLSPVDGAILWSVSASNVTDTSAPPRIVLDPDNNIVAATHLGFGGKFRSSDGAVMARGTAGAVSPGISIGLDPFGNFVVAGNVSHGTILTKFGPVTPGRYTAFWISPCSPMPSAAWSAP